MLPRIPLTLALGALTLMLFVLAPPGDPVFNHLALDRTQPYELWRNLTAHWLHIDAAHLQWNLIALLVLAGVIEHRDSAGLPLVGDLSLGMVAVSVWFWLTPDSFDRYVGLSGILNTLLVTAAYLVRDRIGLWLAGLIVVGALVKSLAELATGASALGFGAGEWLVASGAHIAGWMAGVIAVGARRLSYRGGREADSKRPGSKNPG